MSLHGHATIELTDVRSGITKTIEHDNMLTSYYSDVFTPTGMYGSNMVKAINGLNPSDEPTWDKTRMFGGVLLFEDALDDDPNNYEVPSNNHVIARGFDAAYSGTDNTIGSYNSAVSVVEKDSATFVWDWTQERGNGTISAISLAPVPGAIIGGVSDYHTDDSSGMLINPLKYRFESATRMSQWIAAHVDEEDSYVYYISYASNQLRVRKVKMPVFETDLMLLVVKASSGSSRVDDVSVYDETSINISSYSLGGNPASACLGGKLYLTSETTNWSNGSSKNFVIYDFKTGEITTKNVTNNTGEAITIQAYQTTRLSAYVISDDNVLYAQTTAKHIGYINLTDNTDCGIVKDGLGAVITRTNNHTYTVLLKLFGKVMFSDIGQYDVNSAKLYVVDEKGVARRRGLGPASLGNYTYGSSVDGGTKYRSYMADQSYGALYTVYNPMCVATKNTLDRPVTKTADMTMRITYTIRKEED